MKFCPKCKKEHLIFHSKFCCDCGSKLKNIKDPECPHCKSMIFGKFCGKCGLKFNKILLKKAKISV